MVGVKSKCQSQVHFFPSCQVYHCCIPDERNSVILNGFSSNARGIINQYLLFVKLDTAAYCDLLLSLWLIILEGIMKAHEFIENVKPNKFFLKLSYFSWILWLNFLFCRNTKIKTVLSLLWCISSPNLKIWRKLTKTEVKFWNFGI